MRWWRCFWLVVCVATALAAKHAEKSHKPDEAEASKTEQASPPSEEEPAQEEVVLPPLFKPPYELVRKLEIVQDRITVGNREAHVYQRALIADIAEQFARMPDGVWKQARNARAAITYVLGGGDPFILEKLAKLDKLGGGVDANLLKGLIAYSHGRNTEALELLVNVKASRLGAGAGGHLALAQATLAADDPVKALAFLDQARLMAPGTLVEEAALRRVVVMAAKAGNAEKFLLSTSQYLRRFHKSVYAPNFLKNFAMSVATSKFSDDASMRGRLEETLDRLTGDRRKVAYLALAEAGVLHGRIELAKMATRKAGEFAATDAAFALRLQLYGAAVNIVTDEYDQAVAALKSIDPAKLSTRDRDLLNASLVLAARLREPPQEAAETQPASAAQGENVEMKDMPPAVVEGRKSIATADNLLHGAGR